MTRVLIPYGTTEGLTARISEYVADVIRGHGHEARAVDIKGSRVPKLEGYDAVIVGASIHMGKHEDYVLDFVGKTATRSSASRRPSSP
jgi:menaquinone-dependent protoporphyrinogen oxidase